MAQTPGISAAESPYYLDVYIRNFYGAARRLFLEIAA